MCMACDCFEDSVENPFPVAKKMVKDKGCETSLTKYAINCEFRMTSLIKPCYLFTLDNVIIIIADFNIINIWERVWESKMQLLHFTFPHPPPSINNIEVHKTFHLTEALHCKGMGLWERIFFVLVYYVSVACKEIVN